MLFRPKTDATGSFSPAAPGLSTSVFIHSTTFDSLEDQKGSIYHHLSSSIIIYLIVAQVSHVYKETTFVSYTTGVSEPEPAQF